MLVDRLELRDFRSYLELTLELRPGVNVLVGPNGIGKTNVIEAIAYISTLSSHRVAQDLPLVNREGGQATIRLEFVRGEVTSDGDMPAASRSVAEIAVIPGRSNRLQISGSPVKPRELVGQLRTVVFAPEDLGLVKGDPAARRKFLDEVLIQRAPRYLGIRADYERVLKQRNALLKSMSKSRFRSGGESHSGSGADDNSTLKIWNEQLAEQGAALLYGRLALVSELAPLMTKAYEQVAPGKPAVVGYQARSFVDAGVLEPGEPVPVNREELANLILSSIEAKSSEEIARGITLVGPHRDDLVLTVDGLLAKHYASHGECWSVALSLRLASFELMRGIDSAGDPVLILDDVFAELDSSRREALANFAAGVDQAIITAAVANDVPDQLAGTTFVVTPGNVVQGEVNRGEES